MAPLLNPVVAESHPLVVLERAALRWRQSRSADRFPAAVEDRIRRVFHLGLTDPLPLVRQNALRDYHAHLAEFLSFPFRASYWGEAEPLVLDTAIATGLCDPARMPLDSATGSLCEVVFRNAVRLPLALLKVDRWDSNCQMIDDYWHWFWNCR
jgi:hypothetical protein